MNELAKCRALLYALGSGIFPLENQTEAVSANIKNNNLDTKLVLTVSVSGYKYTIKSTSLDSFYNDLRTVIFSINPEFFNTMDDTDSELWTNWTMQAGGGVTPLVQAYSSFATTMTTLDLSGPEEVSIEYKNEKLNLLDCDFSVDFSLTATAIKTS
jgi:hypothetical protein